MQGLEKSSPFIMQRYKRVYISSNKVNWENERYDSG